MLENLQKYEVILASNSPRRRELLTNLGEFALQNRLNWNRELW